MKKILFFGGGSVFMMNAISYNLKDAGFEVTNVESDIFDINRKRNDSQIVIMYLSHDLAEDSALLVYVKDMCQEQNKVLFVIGDEMELAQCRKYIPDHVITKTFTKPLDIPKLVVRIQQADEEPDSHKKSVLLVDDDPDYLKLVGNWLSKQYRVVIVNSGMQAITYLATHKPDLILLDYSMPVTNGSQLMEMIRSETDTERIPVIFLTGRDDRESVMDVLRLKPDGYLLKSISKNELLIEIEKFFLGWDKGK